MLKDRICKYCGKLFKDIEGRVFSNHVRWCDKNPKDRTEEFRLRNEQLKQNIINKFGELKTYKVTCFKCGKEFEVQEREKLFPKKEKYFCSRKCANSHVRTAESKEKTSKSICEYYAKNGRLREKRTVKKRERRERKFVKRICKYCGKELITIKSKYCSDECRKKAKYEYYLNKHVTDIEKEKFLVRKYRCDCNFQFNLADYPDKFDFDLIRKYGWYKPKNHGNNLGGVSRDHMYSIMDGYINHIDPKIMSHPANCRLIRHNENIAKGGKSCITLEELLKRIKNWDNN